MGSKNIKRVAKRTLKKIARRVKDYLHQLGEDPEGDHGYSEGNHDHSRDEFAYPWLNAVFARILREGSGLRPNYAWGVLNGAYLASALEVRRISVIEFGVAGGMGLISLEKIASKVEPVFDIVIDVYGFDTGVGLPKPLDYRDMPNLYTESTFLMNPEKLRARLQRSQLFLGLVEDTIPAFVETNPAPVAFVSFDLDYYSSTAAAFKLLDDDQRLLMPRVHCYFDDIMGFSCSEFNGERLAISQFNASHTMRKISPIYGLKYFLPARHAHAQWTEMMYMAHIFDHEQYSNSDGMIKLTSRDLSRC